MDTVIINGTIIDPHSGTVTPNAVLLARNGTIVDVGPAQSMGIPDGVPVIDAHGGWIVPGLINLHVHFSLDSGRSPVESMERESHLFTAIRASGHARQAVESGVTTARDLGSRDGLAVELRDAIAAGHVMGPRIFASGLAITMTGGHGWYVGREADGPEEIRKAVRGQVHRGADVIKMMASGGAARGGERAQAKGLTVVEMQAGVDEAHRAGLAVAAHALTEEAARDAVEAGVDSIEHGAVLSDRTIEQMREREVALVSTLAVHQELLSAVPGDPYLDAHKLRAQGLSEARRDSLLRAVQAGVKIGAGSDAGTVLNRHDDFVRELEEFVKLGISNLDAIRAATIWAAAVIRASDVGDLTSGKRADVIILDQDPRQEIAAYRHPMVVVKAGQVVRDWHSKRAP